MTGIGWNSPNLSRCSLCQLGGMFVSSYAQCKNPSCPGPPPPTAEPEGPAMRIVMRDRYRRHEFLQSDGSYLLCSGPGKCAECARDTDRQLGKRQGGYTDGD